LENENVTYIHACLVEFDNGARLYHIQPHPEMASSGSKANFLVRQNKWVADDKEMGKEYYENSLRIPEDVDLSVVQVITRFVTLARKHLEEKFGKHFIDPEDNPDLEKYLLE